jgi:hypothetical protein
MWRSQRILIDFSPSFLFSPHNYRTIIQIITTTLHHFQATIGYYQPKADGTLPKVDDVAIILGLEDMDPREVFINDIRGKDLYRA